MRRAPDRLHVVAQFVARRAGAGSDRSAQNHPGGGSAAEDKCDSDKALDHGIIMRQVVRYVKYFVTRSRTKLETVKTNAVRMLDAAKISYELREYQVDPEDLSAETVAAKVNLPLEQVFKTLVMRGDRSGVCLAVVPGNTQ